MKVWVTGATGLLGREVMKALRTVPGLAVTGGCWSRRAPECERVDLTDVSATEAFLNRFRPDVIVHAAAERRPDVGENNPDLVQALNVAACRTLARWSAEAGCAMIAISTDYVFDGTKPPYAPDSEPHPINRYGESKLAGERAIRDAGLERGCVLRVPILFGPTGDWAESAVTILARKMLDASAGATLEMDNWAIRYPTYTTDVAAVLRTLVLREREGKGLRGIQHWSGDEPFTKYTMARVMASVIGFDPARLQPVNAPSAGAPRPKDAHLITTVEGIAKTPFAQAVEQVLRGTPNV
ncbi:MAG: SDR family oxidoreductase [Kiritimatiellae bacterium]|nr:SDR family oxidoreductase [Kiritimatiellia bacterium]